MFVRKLFDGIAHSATGSAVVASGQFLVLAIGRTSSEGSLDEITSIGDNLGNTWTFVTKPSSTGLFTSGIEVWQTTVTVPGTLTTVSWTTSFSFALASASVVTEWTSPITFPVGTNLGQGGWGNITCSVNAGASNPPGLYHYMLGMFTFNAPNTFSPVVLPPGWSLAGEKEYPKIAYIAHMYRTTPPTGLQTASWVQAGASLALCAFAETVPRAFLPQIYRLKLP